MFDRQTLTLWSNLTGEAVVGPLSQSNVKLKILPMTLTTWGAWKKEHPESTVLKPDPELEKRWGFDYKPGAADRARAGVSFPIWLKNSAVPPKAEVYAIRLDDKPKAYSIDAVLKVPIINDQIGKVPVVLISDPNSGSIRAYHRTTFQFQSAPAPHQLKDQTGRIWKVQDDSLTSDSEKPLPRIPGHISLWFAWYGFFPQTELYTGK